MAGKKGRTLRCLRSTSASFRAAAKLSSNSERRVSFAIDAPRIFSIRPYSRTISRSAINYHHLKKIMNLKRISPLEEISSFLLKYQQDPNHITKFRISRLLSVNLFQDQANLLAEKSLDEVSEVVLMLTRADMPPPFRSKNIVGFICLIREVLQRNLFGFTLGLLQELNNQAVLTVCSVSLAQLFIISTKSPQSSIFADFSRLACNIFVARLKEIAGEIGLKPSSQYYDQATECLGINLPSCSDNCINLDELALIFLYSRLRDHSARIRSKTVFANLITIYEHFMVCKYRRLVRIQRIRLVQCYNKTQLHLPLVQIESKEVLTLKPNLLVKPIDDSSTVLDALMEASQ